MATGFPGYDGTWPREAASIAEILSGNHYSTAAFGKWHNTPDHELSAAGPFDRWPTGKGFDYWYGFQGGEASQWHTPLFENTAPVEPPHDNPHWHFSEAIAEKAISWISQQQAGAPEKPFFVYFAPGACHSPHHVAKEWADKYKGRFDHGWDRQREITLEQQKKLGLVPANTELTPRPESIPSWDSRSADEKRLYARMQEVFAGFLEHADAQVVDGNDSTGTSRALRGSEGRHAMEVRHRRRRHASTGRRQDWRGTLRATGGGLLHRERDLRRRLRHGLAGLGPVPITVRVYRDDSSRDGGYHRGFVRGSSRTP